MGAHRPLDGNMSMVCSFSVKEFNVPTNGTSAGSIAILVRNDSPSLGIYSGVKADLLNLRFSIPSLRLIKKSEPSGLRNGITSEFYMS